jgi:hypothetical protein
VAKIEKAKRRPSKQRGRPVAKASRAAAPKQRLRARPRDVDRALREHVLNLLDGHSAHVTFDQAVADFPPELRGVRPAGLMLTAWRLLEHMRIAQWDIIEFSRDAKHASPDFPGGYWPATDAPPDNAAWDRSVQAFGSDLRAMKRLVKNPATDLAARIPHGTGQTILREALLVADHNAYHIGQIVLLRRLLGAWPGE